MDNRAHPQVKEDDYQRLCIKELENNNGELGKRLYEQDLQIEDKNNAIEKLTNECCDKAEFITNLQNLPASALRKKAAKKTKRDSLGRFTSSK